MKNGMNILIMAKGKKATDHGQTARQTDRPADVVSYRVAWVSLEIPRVSQDIVPFAALGLLYQKRTAERAL